MDAVLSLVTGQDEQTGHGDEAIRGGLDALLIVGGILAWARGETSRAQDLLLRASNAASCMTTCAARRSPALFLGTLPASAANGMHRPTGIGELRRASARAATRMASHGLGTTAACSPVTAAT